MSWLGVDFADIIATGWQVVMTLMPGLVFLAMATAILGLVIRRLYLALVGRPDGVGDSPIVRSPGAGSKPE